MIDKPSLRTHYLKLRSLSDINQHQIIEKISENFFKILKNYSKDTIIAGYLATEEELNLFHMLKMAEEQGYQIAMPVVTEQNSYLNFRLCGTNPSTTRNKYYKKLLEPTNNYPYIVPDIIITPLLVCDRKGIRLGYGGGFYDKTLAYLRAKFSSLLTLGICHHNFLSNDPIPAEPFDQILDIIITDKETVIINQKKLQN